jgi:hypothetical protein
VVCYCQSHSLPAHAQGLCRHWRCWRRLRHKQGASGYPATRLPQNGCGGVLPPALATKRRGAEPQSAITATDDLSSWERLTNLPALREIPGPTGVCSASMGSATIPREAAWAGPGCQALILDDVQRLAWRRANGLSCKALAH